MVVPRTALPMMATNHDGGEFNIKITKESCKACDKFILTHNRINTCKKCKTIYHAECSKNHFKFNHLTRQWHCLDCITNSVPRYNPFNDLETGGIRYQVPDITLVGGSFFLPKTQLVHGTNWWVYCPFSRKTVSTWY